MPDNNKNRFQVSLLDRKRANDAVTEEVLVDKDSGQILVKNRDGHIVSYDHLTRTANSVALFSQFLRDKGIYTNIYMVQMEKPYPVITKTPNILTDTIKIVPVSEKIFVMFDISVLKPLSAESSVVSVGDHSPSIQMSVTGVGEIQFDEGTGPMYEIEYPRSANVRLEHVRTGSGKHLINCILVAYV